MITDDEIRRVVPPRSYAAGVRYHLDGRVQELRMAADGTTINALVVGSGHTIYEQSIRLQRGRNGRLTEADLEMLFGQRLMAACAAFRTFNYSTSLRKQKFTS